MGRVPNSSGSGERLVKKLLKLPPRAPSLRVKPTFMQKSKYRHLLDDPSVYRWFRKLLRRSPASAGEPLRKTGWLCEHLTLPRKKVEGQRCSLIVRRLGSVLEVADDSFEERFEAA